MSQICAVIPAAGRGSRLGLDRPKVFAPLSPGRTAWDLLWEKLEPLVDRAVLVLSPPGLAYAKKEVQLPEAVTLGLQPEPAGMGDAIFQVAPMWQSCSQILVVWGDQLSISAATLQQTLQAHRGGLTVPLALMSPPYVQYDREGDRLLRVRESREGDQMDETGWSDVGIFLLDTRGLAELWHDYLAGARRGGSTNEINFLPFLPWLSSQAKWKCSWPEVEDSKQVKGLNTPDDLAYFQAQSTS